MERLKPTRPKMGRRFSRPKWADRPRDMKMTYPLANSSRKKERRWPLVLRFTKGAIHGSIIFPVVSHACFSALVVFLNRQISSEVSLPSSIIPSLSIVVGLMLVFRNQTAYTRVWQGRLHLTTITNSIRCMSRQMLALSPAPIPNLHHDSYSENGIETLQNSQVLPIITTSSEDDDMQASYLSLNSENLGDSQDVFENNEEAKYTEESVNILIAILYTVKTHMRANWGVDLSPGTYLTPEGQIITSASYNRWLPKNLRGHEAEGLALTLELVVFIESFVGHGVHKNWFHNAAASSMLSSLNQLISAYGDMETIRLTPIPVAHLIHQRQTLALFCLLLPLAIVSEIGWWSVPLVAFVAFTLYGIEGIAQTFEDPFAKVKGDVDLDNVIEDARREVEVLLDAWRESNVGRTDLDARRSWMFVPRTEPEQEAFKTTGLRVSDAERAWNREALRNRTRSRTPCGRGPRWRRSEEARTPELERGRSYFDESGNVSRRQSRDRG